MKSGLVPTMVAEGTKFSVSPFRELTETARGETALTPSILAMVLTSFKVRLDFKYCVDVVSSVTIESTVERVEVGRTTMRLSPILETWEETRFLMLPIRERMRIIEATPIEMPRQVRKERVRLRFREDLASS